MKTGKDEWRESFPIHFKAYGEYKLPVQIYLSIPGIYFFGLNELGIRITPVIYGTLTVLVMFFLGRALFQNELAGLASAFLLGISPWHIHLTRASFESSLATFWVSLGIWFFIKGFKDQKWFVISMIPFVLSIFTYNSARIFTPLFLLAVLVIYRKKLLEFKKKLNHALWLTLVFTGLLAVAIFIFRNIIVDAIFKVGQFKDADRALTASVVGIFMFSAVSQSLMHVVTRAYYSFQNTKTPFWVSVFAIALNVALSYILGLKFDMGVRGIAVATAIAYNIHFILLLITSPLTSCGPLLD